MSSAETLYREFRRNVDLSRVAPKSVAIVFGTRPEIIKLAGIIGILRGHARTIYSGQHFEARLSRLHFSELDLPAPDLILGVGGRSRARQLSTIVAGLEEAFNASPPEVVVVQGDTNTAAGAALAANAMEIPLVHIEAGLRSFDRRMPEEHNRVIADHLADVCCAPTVEARANLLDEGISDERIVVTGNTVVDLASRLSPSLEEREALLSKLGLVQSGFILATFHRPENVDDPVRLRVIIEELAAVGIPVVIPVHPRTRRRIREFGLGETARGVRTLPPLGYTRFLSLAAGCALLVTDSGGLQEEATILKRPILVVRRSTERPEILGSFSTLVPSLEEIGQVSRAWLADLEDRHHHLAGLPSPYGDGWASTRCVTHLARLISDGGRRMMGVTPPNPARRVRTLAGSMGDRPLAASNDGSDPLLYSKVASIDDLGSSIVADLLGHCERVQAEFLRQDHRFRSEGYEWPRDALHSWSRVWEYPYVLHHLRRWRSELDGKPGMILDFGSGVTFFPFMLARDGFRVQATDIDPVSAQDFERALACLPIGRGDLGFRLASQDRIPFEDGTFSALYSISVLEHVPDLETTVEELARIIEPGGLMVLTLDLSLNDSHELVPSRYEQLRSLLDRHFEPALTERVTHPAKMLRNTNGLYPMYSHRSGLRSLMQNVLRIPAHVRAHGLSSTVRRSRGALKAVGPGSAAARYDLACQGLVLRRASK
jgi:UDP-N-acetylglucosamine 2-epimerase (non-hydrolysing)